MATGQRILVALSGGVDSAVAAWRLKAAGFAVEAAYMKNWINEADVFGPCPWEEDIQDARAVCKHLDIPFHIYNGITDYRERVVRYLVEGYRSGLTPNPDVMCNREMKFGVLRDWARAQGYEGVATGHYCQRGLPEAPGAGGGSGWSIPDLAHWRQGPSGAGGTVTATATEVVLCEGADRDKDQSYFLCMTPAEQLQDALFPIGHLRKAEVRELAHAAGLPVAGKKDSQGICFVGEVKINDFLAQFIPEQPGEIVTREGRVVGEHRGLHRYTLGQRRGIGVPSNTDNQFYVVVGKDLEQNRLIVAFESDRAEAIWHGEAQLAHINWLTATPPGKACDLSVKVRYRDPQVAAAFIPEVNGDTAASPSAGRLVFAEDQRALAAGQICALYEGSRLIGGGVFC